MSGEIETAFIALMPSFRGFGAESARQLGPIATQLGSRAGQQAGAAFSSSAARESRGWFEQTASMAVKNVALYGSMYAVIQNAQRGIDAIIESMVGFNSEIQQSNNGFKTLLGSAAAARDEMAWIKTFAKETPFQYRNLVQYSQQLLALGFNAEMSKDVLEATGDAAAALGRGSESIARINLALGQMWTKGKVQSQEMLQLTEAGIGAWQILAQAYGATVEQVQEAVTAGNVKAAEAVPALIDGMNLRFGGLMEQQSRTYAGIISNIQDTLQQELASAGEPLFRELTAQAERFLDALDDPTVVATMRDLGQGLADGAHFLAVASEAAWEWRDALLAVAAGYASLKIAQNLAMRWETGGTANDRVNSMFGGTAGAWRAAAAVAKTANAEAEASARMMAQAQSSYASAATRWGQTSRALAAANAEVKASIWNYDRWTQATIRLRAAEVDHSRAQAELTALAPARISAERASATAAEVSADAERKLATARMAALRSAGTSALTMLGPMVGITALADGTVRTAKAAKEGEEAMLGFAEATAGGAIAGAGFGLMLGGPLGAGIGAAVGGVAGLTISMVAYSDAASKAAHDTSLALSALEQLGVDATVASLALAGMTNQQLDAVGGVSALRAALKEGVGADEFLADLKARADGIKAQIDAINQAVEVSSGDGTSPAPGPEPMSPEDAARLDDLTLQYEDLTAAIAELVDNSPMLEAAFSQMAASGYEAAFAADMQTGSLGAMTEAAWNAVVAQGGLGKEAMYAAARMEGLAGVAGYATQAIAGIPTGTAINFTTNASEILQQILALQAAASAGFGSSSAATQGVQQRIASLQAQYENALKGTSTLSLPPVAEKAKKGGRSTDLAAQAAAEAARKLERDRDAQVRFGDAFGTLMESALEGDFERYRERLAEQITSLTRDGYTAAADELKRTSPALTQAAQDYAALTSKLKAASSAYEEVTGQMRDQYAASRDLVLSLGQATDAQSFDQLAYLLGETTSRVADYQAVLAQLKAQGLSDDLWNQLAQAGPESMGLAQSILDQGQAGIDQLNSLSDGLVSTAESMGDMVAKAMYGNGANALKQFIDGLKSGSSALEAQMETIANTVLNKTAGMITPGNAGYSAVSAAPQQVVYQFGDITFDASKLGDLAGMQDFINMLNQAATTQLVNQAGTVIS